MDIQLIETAVPVWKELCRQTKTAHITVESVVPDTKEDIGRILSVRPEIKLKSKDLIHRGASVGGEAEATLLYVGETGESLSYVGLSQPFNMEFDLPEADDSCIIQAHFISCVTQARALNPRKVLVEFEVGCELILSRYEELPVSQKLPDELPVKLHVLTEESSVVIPCCVCEKSFSVSVQLPFPDMAPQAKEIITKEISYDIRDKETVGSRLLIKGEVQILLHYLAEDSLIPQNRLFTTAFSQLVDLGDSEADAAELWIEETSDYLSLIDAIEGPKLLDIELHGLIQVRGRKTEKETYVADAYCNSMPVVCDQNRQVVTKAVREQRVVLAADETVDLPEDSPELYACYPTLGLCTCAQGMLALDILCGTGDGKLSAIRRSVSLSPQETYGELSGEPFSLKVCSYSVIDGKLSVRARVEAETLEYETAEQQRTVAVRILDDQKINTSDVPAFTAVWHDGESVWELAKAFHSSPEAIQAMNEDLSQSPLFIPNCL